MTALRKALPVIDVGRCTGCGWCVAVCGPHVLSLHVYGFEKSCHLDDPAACTGCALCAVRCPFDAIQMVRCAESGNASRGDHGDGASGVAR